jgi:hypothetical protein
MKTEKKFLSAVIPNNGSFQWWRTQIPVFVYSNTNWTVEIGETTYENKEEKEKG